MNNNLHTQLLENDLNPYLLFDSNGKLIDFNKEAEFLLNFTKPKELYELAICHASISYGFNHKYIGLKYEKIKYYAILVGYINDNEIALRLYKEITSQKEIVKIKNIEPVNIFSLIDLSKATVLLQSDIKIKEIYDVSIPQIKLNINEFLLILNDCFALFKNLFKLIINVYIKIGEYEIIHGKKYKVMAIKFTTTNSIVVSKILQNRVEKTHINIFYNQNILILELPMIL